MFINKSVSPRNLIAFTGGHLIWISIWVALVTALHDVLHLHWLHMPWLPISVLATAVAFYIGFKNNQAYDRLWEARKIWGGIVNSSRAWGSMSRAYLSNQFVANPQAAAELKAMQQRLIYRHIAWLYVLRSQLLIPTNWEHINQGLHAKKNVRRMQKRIGVCLFSEKENVDKIVEDLLGKEEYEEMIGYKNMATQLIDKQAQELAGLRANGFINDFRHIDLQKILYHFYEHQGKCERIKKFPLPRQYGGMSAVFVGIFIFLLPFGMITEFHDYGAYGAWWSVPFTILIAWVYLTMELIGDYSENPFEGLGNDIPMLSLCRTIEIDLRQMLDEQDLPPAIEPINGVLM